MSTISNLGLEAAGSVKNLFQTVSKTVRYEIWKRLPVSNTGAVSISKEVPENRKSQP